MPSYKGVIKTRPYGVALKYIGRNDSMVIIVTGSGERKSFKMYPRPDRVSQDFDNDPNSFYKEAANAIGNFYGKNDAFPEKRDRFQIMNEKYSFIPRDKGEADEMESEG